jgi:chaperonin GroEL (HSP60 family)
VTGGGASLLRAAVQAAPGIDASETDRMAAKVLARALGAPLRAIVGNRGRDATHISGLVASSCDARSGYDADGDRIADLHTAGIVDACDVTVEALLRAVATAVTLASVAAATASVSK